MRESHVIQDHHKVILRGSQQVRTENDSQSFGRHVIMLFVVGNSSREREKGSINLIQKLDIVVTRQRTCQDVLTPVEGYQNWLEEGLEQLYGCSTIVYPNFPVLQKKKRIRNDHLYPQHELTHCIHHIMIRRRRKHRFWQNPEPRFHQITDSMNISRLSDGIFASIVSILEGVNFGYSTRNPIFFLKKK